MKRKILVVDAHTNGHDAVLKLIRKMRWKRRDCEIVFCGSHENVLKRLTEGPGFAVVPIHNSIVGTIEDVVWEIKKYRDLGFDLVSIAEIRMSVKHCLLAQSDVMHISDLERVVSHEKAILQCTSFLDRNGFPRDRLNRRESTGSAARYVSGFKSRRKIGAIATKSAARAYGLKIMAENIQDETSNATTFYLIENKMAIEHVTVGILGIAGRFGKVLKRFFESTGCDVIGYDPKIRGSSIKDVVKGSQVIVLAVPIAKAVSMARSIASLVREDQLLIDITSIKEPVVHAMLDSKAQVLGLHPMFAPEVPMEGQTIVACASRLTVKCWKKWSVNMLAATKTKIKWSTPKEHDGYMATVQSSPHLANLVNAILIKEGGVSTTESLTFTSPFYRVMFSLMGRLLGQDPELYASIIMSNPASVAMLKKRIVIEKSMLAMIRRGDRRSFRKLFIGAREHFGRQEISEADELFMRLIAVTKTLYGSNTVLIEFSKAANHPGLLENILKAFRQNKVNLSGINFVKLDAERMQFAISFEQSRASSEVERALEKITSWGMVRIL